MPSPLVAAIAASVLACDWGRRIATPDDRARCPQRAAQLVALHDPHQVAGGHGGTYKVCADHFARLQQETDPHQEVTGDAP